MASPEDQLVSVEAELIQVCGWLNFIDMIYLFMNL